MFGGGRGRAFELRISESGPNGDRPCVEPYPTGREGECLFVARKLSISDVPFAGVKFRIFNLGEGGDCALVDRASEKKMQRKEEIKVILPRSSDEKRAVYAPRDHMTCLKKDESFVDMRVELLFGRNSAGRKEYVRIPPKVGEVRE